MDNSKQIKASYKKNWPRKNLSEVINFIERVGGEDGSSLASIAEHLGTTKGSVSNVFCHDDMKLSKAEYIARCYGYRLKLLFPLYRQDDDYVPPEPKLSFPNAGNLAGLIKNINDRSFTVSFLASRIGISPNVLYRAFRSGDIALSVLNRCTDYLDIRSTWDFEKIDS